MASPQFMEEIWQRDWKCQKLMCLISTKWLPKHSDNLQLHRRMEGEGSQCSINNSSYLLSAYCMPVLCCACMFSWCFLCRFDQKGCLLYRKREKSVCKIEWKYNMWSQWIEGNIVRDKQHWWENLQGVYIPGTLRGRWAVNQVKFQPNEAGRGRLNYVDPARLSQCLFLKRMDCKWKWLEKQ